MYDTDKGHPANIFAALFVPADFSATRMINCGAAVKISLFRPSDLLLLLCYTFYIFSCKIHEMKTDFKNLSSSHVPGYIILYLSYEVIFTNIYIYKQTGS